MQEEMASDIEQIVHDHYHDIHFSLPLSDGQNLVKRITGAHYKADGTIADITTEVNPNGKQLDVTIDWLCRQISVDFILEVELDTSVYNKQTVIPADSIIVNHEGTNGGLHSGIFDNEIVVDLQLDFPAAELDRTAHNITFQNADGVDAITNKLSGEIVTLPMGEGIIKEGSSFGGWNVVSGANLGHHYNPGEIISMPSGDMTLAPAFGNVEVELAIDYTQGEKPDYKNQMAEFTYSPFNFNGKLMSDGNTIDENSIVSIQFIDFLPQYDTMPNDPDATRVKLTNVPNAVYARHIGATDEDRVVAYLAPSQSEDGKYDLYVAGHGG